MSPESGGPVFIVGAPRSGTSILYRTLLKHPDFAVEGDEALQLAESAVLHGLPSAPRWRAPRPPRLWLFFLQDEAGYAEFLAEVRRLTAGQEAVPADLRPPWTGPVLEAFVRHASAVRGCRRLLEKTPTHIDRAEWLLDSLPSARLLFIHRHPLDTYTSYLRRARVDPKATWADLSVEDFSSVYRRHTRKAKRLEATRPDRFLTFSYESFTSDPEPQTEVICRWLEVDFDASLVHEESPDLTRSRNDPHLFGAITASTKDWSEFIDPHTARRLEEATADAARAWRYSIRPDA